MLRNTFHHISGIGLKMEEKLWSAGLLDWQTAVAAHGLNLPLKNKQAVLTHIHESMTQLHLRNPSYFEKRLPSGSHWRLFPEFRAETAFLDIETDGLDNMDGMITTIALYDGVSIRHYVNGRNLEAFVDDIRPYKILVTYNGKCFDVPFIEKYFRIKLTQTQIDLRYVLAGLGFKGGLKRCEAAFGIDRGDLKGLDGFFAPLLFQEYERNRNPKALETLLAYNIEDVVNLETLMVLAYNRNIERTPFLHTHALPEPESPDIPFKADLKTVEKIKRGIIQSEEETT